MDAAVAALGGTVVGAVIGVIGTTLSMWLQQRQQTRRERLKLAADLGLADFNHTIERLKKQAGGGPLPPLSLFVAYHAEVLTALADDNFSPPEVEAIEKRQAALYAAMPRRYREHDLK